MAKTEETLIIEDVLYQNLFGSNPCLARERRLGGKIMNYAWDANCDGIEITEEDVDYLMKAIDLALHRIKQKNKEKYTLKKYK